MLIDRLAVVGLHWTARTLVSLFDTRRSTPQQERDTRGGSRESLELASPSGSPIDESDDGGAAEALNVRAPDIDLLSTIEQADPQPPAKGGQ